MKRIGASTGENVGAQRDPEFYTLPAANLGASVIPWALL
jgi:hypothetical protein